MLPPSEKPLNEEKKTKHYINWGNIWCFYDAWAQSSRYPNNFLRTMCELNNKHTLLQLINKQYKLHKYSLYLKCNLLKDIVAGGWWRRSVRKIFCDKCFLSASFSSIAVLPQPESMYLFCTQLFSFIPLLIKVTLLHSSSPDFWHYQYFSYLACLPPPVLSFMSLSKALTGGQSWERIWGWDVPVLVSVRIHLLLVYHLVFMIWSLYMITQTWTYE